MSPALAVQKALRSRFIADPAVNALVVADRVLALSGLPEGPFPVVLLGQDDEVAADEVARRYVEVNSTVHVWTDEPGMSQAKEIGSAIYGAVRDELPAQAGVRFHDSRFVGAGYMRDSGGKLTHGVITIRSIVEVTS